MTERRNIITGIYNSFTPIARKVTKSYEQGFGVPCDLYFPMHAPKRDGRYTAVNLFEPHELPDYPEEPSYTDVYFYIIGLMRKESMNSIDAQFDNFALKTSGKEVRPFIETDPDNELPICTKVVVHLGTSEVSYFVDKKTVVNGASGQMLMRMYLSPLTKDTNEREV